ncbi:hypothetical protein M0534_00190 [Methylonatrum kenyense]|uniref:hypothetical protein n=1 Tax=Methylonatrum kenyense TaxID=455253 RepID=UPI0020BDF787|nr:hypothetical protein [Methylonatrum kenyense]MCK8514751.1 hypothetical protein [Methylonatrum kenyense]
MAAAFLLIVTAAILIVQRDNLPAVALAVSAAMLLAGVSLAPPRYSLLASRDFREWTLVERWRGGLEQRALRTCYCGRYLVSLRLGPAAGRRWSLPVTVLVPADALPAAQHRKLRIGLLRLGS